MGVLTRFVGCGGVELICNISVALILDSTFIAQYYFFVGTNGRDMQPQTATSHSQQPRGIERGSQNTSLEYEILLLLDTTKPRCPPFNALFP